MVLGLGTGSTTKYALEKIARDMKAGLLKNIIGIPSSVKTAHLAQELGIPLGSLENHAKLDLTIDGADEVDPQLNLIKGGGGALLREKILAQISRKEVIIVDEGKLSSQLGSKWAVPVEVLPYAWYPVSKFLESLGAAVTMRLNRDGSIYKTDQDNLILDCNFGPIENPEKIARQLESRAGIIEHGLFINLAHEVIVASPEGIRTLTVSS